MNRRGFLGLVAGLPLVGRLIPKGETEWKKETPPKAAITKDGWLTAMHKARMRSDIRDGAYLVGPGLFKRYWDYCWPDRYGDVVGGFCCMYFEGCPVLEDRSLGDYDLRFMGREMAICVLNDGGLFNG